MRRARYEPQQQVAEDANARMFLELMLQMLGMFILLTSLSVMVEEKRHAAVGSLAGAVSAMPRGTTVFENKENLSRQAGIDAQEAPKHREQTMTRAIEKLQLPEGIQSFRLDRDTLVIQFPEAILYAPGAIEPDRQLAPLYDRIAQLLTEPEVREGLLLGYTDTTAPVDTQRFTNNWELSAARATGVLRELLQRGAPANRLAAAGMGSEHPGRNRATGEPPERRVELRIRFGSRN